MHKQLLKEIRGPRKPFFLRFVNDHKDYIQMLIDSVDPNIQVENAEQIFQLLFKQRISPKLIKTRDSMLKLFELYQDIYRDLVEDYPYPVIKRKRSRSRSRSPRSSPRISPRRSPSPLRMFEFGKEDIEKAVPLSL